MSTKKKTGAQAASMIAISSIAISDDIPNREEGWEKNLAELIDSIKANGQVQPILVSTSSGLVDGIDYDLVAGQRRIEALKKLGHGTVKAVCIASKTSRKDKFGARVAENFGRMDYSPLEEAALVKYAIEELGMSQQEVAIAFGMTGGWVSQRVSALKQPDVVQKALESGNIAFTHLREFSRVKDDDEKKKLLKHAQKEDASAFKRRVDEIVTGKKPRKRAKKSTEAKALKRDTPRQEKEALVMLKKLQEAKTVTLKSADKDKKEHAAYLSGLAKGVSWAYKLKGSNIKV